MERGKIHATVRCAGRREVALDCATKYAEGSIPLCSAEWQVGEKAGLRRENPGAAKLGRENSIVQKTVPIDPFASVNRHVALLRLDRCVWKHEFFGFGRSASVEVASCALQRTVSGRDDPSPAFSFYRRSRIPCTAPINASCAPHRMNGTSHPSNGTAAANSVGPIT